MCCHNWFVSAVICWACVLWSTLSVVCFVIPQLIGWPRWLKVAIQRCFCHLWPVQGPQMVSKWNFMLQMLWVIPDIQAYRHQIIISQTGTWCSSSSFCSHLPMMRDHIFWTTILGETLAWVIENGGLLYWSCGHISVSQNNTDWWTVETKLHTSQICFSESPKGSYKYYIPWPFCLYS